MGRILSRSFAIDLRALAFFRIGLGIILICDLFNRFPVLKDHYTKYGLLPLTALFGKFSNTNHFSLYFINDTYLFQSFLFLISFCSAVCFLLGYRSKLAAFISWVLLVSLHNRNIMVLQAGDTLLRLLLFWSMFLPLGKLASVDSGLRKDTCEEKEIKNAASFAVLFQVAIMYLMTFLLKDSPGWWPNFTAGLKALYLEQLTTHFGLFLRQFEGLVQASTAVVYILEVLAFILLFSPFWMIRFFGAIALMGMHLSFALSMRIGLFPYTDIVALILFIPRPVWDYLESKVASQQSKVIVFYDRDCGFCRKLVHIICHLLFVRWVKIKEAQSDDLAFELMERNNSWVLRTEKGENLQEFYAIIALVNLSPYFRFFSRILGLFLFRWLGTLAYRLVAGNRKFFGSISNRLFYDPPPLKLNPGKLVSILILSLSGLCLLWNLTFLPQINVSFPPSLKPLMHGLRISQRWNMFAPKPPSTSGWYVIPGTLVDGTEVNVWTKEEDKASFEKPDFVAGTFLSMRWRKYLMNIWLKKNKEYRLYFGKYLCRRWNRNLAEHSKKLLEFRIYFMKQRIINNTELSLPKAVSIWGHNCFK
ncbi:MAG: HTTM domain-containing protein [Oligoflexales bacterium]